MPTGLSEVVTGLLVEVIKSGVIGVSHKLQELGAIRRAFTFSAEPNKKLPEPLLHALNNIEIVFGSHIGILTDDLYEFLKELRGSPLVIMMAEAQLLDIEPDGCFSAFEALFSTHFKGRCFEAGGGKFDAPELYRALRAMLAASLFHQKSKAAEHFIDDARYKEQIRLIAAANNRLRDDYATNGTTASWLVEPEGDVGTFCRSMATQLLHSVTFIFVEGPERRGEKKVRLNDLYVSMPLVSRHQTISENIDDQTSPSVTPARLVAQHKRVVILGDPGGGKSTLAQKLCLDVLTECIETGARLAVRLEIRRYSASLALDPQLSLLHFLIREIQQATNSIADISPWLGHLLRSGRLLVIFDGLDEVLASEEKRSIANFIIGFSESFPFCPMLVTSRRVGYDQAPLPSSLWHHVELGEFGPEEIGAFVRSATRVMFSEDSADIERATEYFATGLTLEARDLVRNPLLLSLMVWLYHERRGDVPDNRAEIYRQCSLLMFERWDRQRKIVADIPDDFDLLDLLSLLASKMYTEREFSSGIDGVTLEKEVTGFFRDIYTVDAAGRAKRAARRVVEFITGRAWVMTEIGNDIYDFTHRTFLEYFYGRYLNDKFETVAGLLDEVTPHILEGEWSIPSHLALQMKSYGRPSSAQAAIAGLLGRRKQVHTFNIDAYLIFILQTTRYLPANEAEIEEVGFSAIMRASSESNWANYIRRAISRVVPRRLALYRGMARAAVQLAQSGGAAFDRVAEWLYLFKTIAVREAEPLDDIDAFLEVCAREFSMQLHRSDAQVAKLMFNISGKIPEREPSFGIDLWAVSNPLEQHNWLEFDFHLMVVHLTQFLTGHEPELSPYARLALYVAKSFVARAPMRIPQGDYVAPANTRGLDIDWSMFFRLPGGDIGVGAAIVALAFLELVASGSGNLRKIVPLSSLAAVRDRILDQFNGKPAPGEIGNFIRDYRRNSRRFFYV